MSHTGLVITASADVFSQPRREGASVSTLTEGCFVAVQERQSEWFRLTLDAAGSGFVDASCVAIVDPEGRGRSEEHTSELQSLMRISYAVFCLKKTTIKI